MRITQIILVLMVVIKLMLMERKLRIIESIIIITIISNVLD